MTDPATTPIRKLLVANRGEIARRVFTTCRRMGIATVAVHSDPDADAPFVAEADEAVPLGGSSAAESYLDAQRVIAAAELSGADAIHPGYGFLAENAAFAQAVLDAGLVWVGPQPSAIEEMGSKVRARALMEGSGVPVLPGTELEAGSDHAVVAEAIGFPLLVKASAGGGGKGMRVVSSAAELEGAIESASREAESAFGDGTVFLERYLVDPRHIEIQVIADRHGTTVSLGERECSIQRRHQKVVEEAPSVAVDDDLRERMGAAAVAAAKAVGYEGAGTVEFLLEAGGEFFFLEMNTRLQVEHPVTEMITGLDLVRLQVLVASGQQLPPQAIEAPIDGHAIEVRLYAEDAANGFLPQTGTVERFHLREAEPFAAPTSRGLRLDSGVEDGSVVSPHYDPMLAKLIAWAPTRAEAAARLAAALADSEIHGLITNRDFLVQILRHEAFGAGATDTGFLERHQGLGEPLAGAEAERLHAVAAALAASAERRANIGPLSFAPAGYRNNRSAHQRVSFDSGRGEIEVAYEFEREGLGVVVDGESLAGVRLHSCGAAIVDLEVAGVRRRFRIRRGGDNHHINSALGQSSLRELPRFGAASEVAAEGALVAPMPGRAIRIAVSSGDQVSAGDVMIVLEAMKMEHELTAPAAGLVAEVLVEEGGQVDAGAVLARLEPLEQAD